MSPFWDGLLGSAVGLVFVGGALALLEWMEKRDARRHQLDLERVRKDQEIADLKAKVEWYRKADRLVIWNGTEWQVRHELKEGGGK